MTRPYVTRLLLVLGTFWLAWPATSLGQTPLGTAFTYQGQLKHIGQPLEGTADFQFSLWDASSAGQQVGATQPVSDVSVYQGLFTALLDFGANPFTGEARWLEIAVRSPAGGGAFTTLTPRQPLTPAPYAVFSGAPWTTSGDGLSYSGGNVGIGTGDPVNKLHVSANGGPAAVVIDGEYSTNPTLYFRQPYEHSEMWSGGDLRFRINDGSGWPDRLTITRAGNLGVGTTDPINRLSVLGSADFTGGNVAIGNTEAEASLHVWSRTGILTECIDPTGMARVAVKQGRAAGVPGAFYMGYCGDSVPGTSDAGLPYANLVLLTAAANSPSAIEIQAGPYETPIVFGVGPGPHNERMRITHNGNVGIGTPSPSATLDVYGTTRTSALQLIDAPHTGYVLTSDSAGNGTWQPPPQTQGIPQGVIVMWSGTLATIPSGWALCDGTNGAPDLRDRFIFGTSAGQNPGATGGSTTHSHTFNTTIQVHDAYDTLWDIDDFGVDYVESVNSNISGTTGTASHLPPYYKLAFIMKL